MTFKDAFHYQNYLSGIFLNATRLLMNNDYVTKKVEEHKRTDADPDAQNESVTVLNPQRIDGVSVDDMVGFACAVQEERALLAKAIDLAKCRCSSLFGSIDAETSANMARRDLCNALCAMMRVKPSEETTGEGRFYRINAEGNQTPCVYSIASVRSVDFDRNAVRAKLKSLLSEADETSTRLDKMMLEDIVEFTPAFDANDSFDDSIETYKEKRRKTPALAVGI